AALRVRGLYLPRTDVLEIAVPRNAARLRSPDAYRRRLLRNGAVRVHWVAPPRAAKPPHAWLADEADALDIVLRTGDRELAVAACDGLVRSWRALIDGRADSWGETYARLRLQDAGVACLPQAVVPGAGRYDLQVSRRVYVEIDGAQHDEEWTGDQPGSFQRDHEKDLVLASLGGRAIRIGYPQ